MPITREKDGYWFPHEGERQGPFDTRNEAREIRSSLQRFEKFQHVRGYVCSETRGQGSEVRGQGRKKRPRMEHGNRQTGRS